MLVEDLLNTLVDHLWKTKYDDLPEEAIARAENQLSDYLGVLIAGSSVSTIRDLLDVYLSEKGTGECTVAVFGEKLPVVSSVIVNTAMARAHDLDDVHEEAVAHMNVGVLPAVMAAVEAMPVSGKELLTAVVLGYDIAARFCLGALVPPGKSGMNIGYHAATLVSALIYGKLTGLSREQLLHAAGIAFCEMSGTDQCLLEGTPMVAIEQGLSCGRGVRAAQLAQQGITGPLDMFTGKFGYYKTYQHGQYDLDLAVKGLGNVYQGTRVSTKLYPCCKFSHSAIEGCLEICGGKTYEADEIQAVTVKLTQQAFTFVCDPVEEKKRPRNIVEAKFSLPYCAAVALRRGNVWIDDFRAEAFGDERTLALSSKVSIVVDEQIEREHSDIIGPSAVEIKFADGSVRSAFVKNVKGHPEKPLSKAEILTKLNWCIDASARPFGTSQRERLISVITRIRESENISALIEYLVV